MAGVLLADADHRDAVRARFRRQVEVHDLREHLAQDRHEHVVQCHRHHRRFVVRRAAHVAALVDRVAAQVHAGDGHHREVVLRVVVAGVVAERAFQRGVVGRDEALQQDLAAGRRIQPGGRAVPHPGALSAQQAGEFVFGERVRHRRHRGERGRGIGTDGDQQWERLVRVRGLPVGEVQRAPAVRQPANDDAVAANHLLPVDRHVLALLAGAAGDHQAKGDQLRCILRPAALDRQPRQVDVIALQHLVLEGGLAHPLRRHVRQLRQLRPGAQCLAQAGRPFRFLDRGQQLAQLAQAGQRPSGQCGFDAVAVAEQVAQVRVPRAQWLFHQQRRPAGLECAQAERGGLQLRVHRRGDPQQASTAFERANEAAQVVEAHPAPPGGFMRSRSRNRIRCRYDRPRACAGQTR